MMINCITMVTYKDSRASNSKLLFHRRLKPSFAGTFVCLVNAVNISNSRNSLDFFSDWRQSLPSLARLNLCLRCAIRSSWSRCRKNTFLLITSCLQKQHTHCTKCWLRAVATDSQRSKRSTPRARSRWMMIDTSFFLLVPDMILDWMTCFCGNLGLFPGLCGSLPGFLESTPFYSLGWLQSNMKRPMTPFIKLGKPLFSLKSYGYYFITTQSFSIVMALIIPLSFLYLLIMKMTQESTASIAASGTFLRWNR